MSSRSVRKPDWGKASWSSRGIMTGPSTSYGSRKLAIYRARQARGDIPMTTAAARPYNRRRYPSRAALNQRTGGLIGLP